MSDVSVNDATNEVLLLELEKRGILAMARKLDTYSPTEKEKIIATGVAYNLDNPRELLATLLSYQYAYERIALEVKDIYDKDYQEYDNFMRGEGTE